MAVNESLKKRGRTIRVSLRETLCGSVCKPVQAESEIAYAKGRVKPLARLLRCATALRVTAPLGCGSDSWYGRKVPFGFAPNMNDNILYHALSTRPPQPTARMPRFVVRCYRTLSNEIQNH